MYSGLQEIKRSLKLREINSKSLKKLKNERSKIFKEKKIISSSLNKRNTSPKHESQEKILLIIKKYSINKN